MKKILLIAILTSAITSVSANSGNQFNLLSKANTSNYSLFDNKENTRLGFRCANWCDRDLTMCLSHPNTPPSLCWDMHAVCLFDLCGIGPQP